MVNDNGGNIWKHVFFKQKIIRRSYMNHGCEGIGGHPNINQNRLLRTEAKNWFRIIPLLATTLRPPGWVFSTGSNGHPADPLVPLRGLLKTG